MKKILYIDATVREDSRTARLARYLLSKLEGEVIPLRLCDTVIPALDMETITRRDIDKESGCFEAPYYDNARQLREADIVVIAAPFWDNSFPAVLKKYIEAVCVNGLTFRYSDKGVPQGMCRAEKLYYVTTSGGFITPETEAFSYGYVKSVFCGLFGIPSAQLIKAEGLDIFGSDIKALLKRAEKEIDDSFAE